MAEHQTNNNRQRYKHNRTPYNKFETTVRTMQKPFTKFDTTIHQHGITPDRNDGKPHTTIDNPYNTFVLTVQTSSETPYNN